mmetsp:Transcript_78743/g.218823  ORF Transcript_78743/g.218823 Transcript_78743/m.218823 type:complete len:240 (+) Transcript_78743:254-973(+)
MSRTAALPFPANNSRNSTTFSAAVPPATSLRGCASTPKSSNGRTSYSEMSPVSQSSHTLLGPSMESSSRTSQPWTTSARFMPSILKTCTKSGPKLGEKTPQSMQSGRPGFVSGPKMLKTVLMPISWRTGPTWRIAGWYARAKRNEKLLAVSTPGTSSGSKSKRAPKASRKSAAPLFDVAARFPCFTTFAPAPAATRAAAVEMLKVSCPSPPVPTMSMMKSPFLGSSKAFAFFRMTSARA